MNAAAVGRSSVAGESGPDQIQRSGVQNTAAVRSSSIRDGQLADARGHSGTDRKHAAHGEIVVAGDRKQVRAGAGDGYVRVDRGQGTAQRDGAAIQAAIELNGVTRVVAIGLVNRVAQRAGAAAGAIAGVGRGIDRKRGRACSGRTQARNGQNGYRHPRRALGWGGGDLGDEGAARPQSRQGKRKKAHLQLPKTGIVPQRQRHHKETTARAAEGPDGRSYGRNCS